MQLIIPTTTKPAIPDESGESFYDSGKFLLFLVTIGLWADL